MHIRDVKANSRLARTAAARSKAIIAHRACRKVMGRNRRAPAIAAPMPEPPAPVPSEPDAVVEAVDMRPPEPEEVDPRVTEWLEFTRAELAAEAQALGLSTAGTKADIAARLVAAEDGGEDASGGMTPAVEMAGEADAS